MISDSEDDALSWEGDDALEARRPTPQRQVPPPPASEHPDAPEVSEQPEAPEQPAVSEEPAAPEQPAVPAASESPESGDATAAEPEGTGTVTLLLLGIFGGVYLLYTIGWAIGGVGMQTKALFMLPTVLYQVSLWVAVLAPALWFAATLLMTKRSKDWVRVVALIVGALLLAPWPFVVAGGGGPL